MKSKGSITENLNKTVKFFSTYVYDTTNRSNTIMAHTADIANISIRILTPFLALSLLHNDDTIGSGLLLLCPLVSPRILSRIKERALAPVTTHVQSQLTAELHKQTFNQPYSQNMNSASGDFAQAIACNYGSVGAFVGKFYGEVLPFMVESSAITVVSLAKFQMPAIIIPSSLLIYAIGLAKFLKKYDKARKDNINTMCQNYGDVLSSISRHKMAKQFNQIDLEQAIVQPALDSSELTSQREEVVRSYTNAWGTFIGYSQLVACFIYAIHLNQENKLGVNDALLFLFFSYVIAMLIDNISNSIIDITKASVDAQTIIEYSARAASLTHSNTPDDLVLDVAPAITFQNVKFSYPQQFPDEPENSILEGLNFTIQPGQTVALVGKTGAGKSTVTQLLQRFYVPKSGNILINGVNIRQISQASLYHNIAVVEQGTEFLRDTWYANIKYARKNATNEQIVEAARLAGLISEQEGVNELLSRNAGISGHSLSGGEKQRIAIARSILKGGLILILDEATSALDPETELKVQETINKLSVGVTTLVITHKLYLLSKVDQVFYLKQGAIIENGSCAELIQRKGAFYQQLHTQLVEQGSELTPEAWLQLQNQSMANHSLSSNVERLLLRNWTSYTSFFYQPPTHLLKMQKEEHDIENVDGHNMSDDYELSSSTVSSRRPSIAEVSQFVTTNTKAAGYF